MGSLNTQRLACTSCVFGFRIAAECIQKINQTETTFKLLHCRLSLLEHAQPCRVDEARLIICLSNVAGLLVCMCGGVEVEPELGVAVCSASANKLSGLKV